MVLNLTQAIADIEAEFTKSTKPHVLFPMAYFYNMTLGDFNRLLKFYNVDRLINSHEWMVTRKKKHGKSS